MLKAILLLLVMIFVLPVRAQYYRPDEAFDLKPEDSSPTSEEIIVKKPEKFLRDEAMIVDQMDEFGIKGDRRWTGTDRNRISASVHLNGSYEYYSKLTGFEVTYLRRSNNWKKLWYGANARLVKTQFSQITQNHTLEAGDNANAESRFQRPKDADQTLTTFGVGAGYRFKLLLDFWKTENVFESVQAYFTYNMLDESFTGQDYKGYGLTADYGIHKRSRTNFFYGGKFTYNIASVERAKLGTESGTDRSLTLGWFSMAFEMGYFY